jgi:hypothetical protein
MKDFIVKLVISSLLGLLVSITAFLFTRGNALKVKDSDILYIKKGAASSTTIRLSCGPGDELSFFVNLYVTRRQVQRGTFHVLADRSNKIFFFVKPNGTPGIEWGEKANRIVGKNCNTAWNKWNHVGFVYKKNKLTIYVNGQKCRETRVPNKEITLEEIELLPGKNRPGAKGESLNIDASYPALFSRALSVQHIKDLQTVSRLYHDLPIKIFFLFLLGTLVGIFGLYFFLPLVSIPGDSNFTSLGFARRNVLFMFLVVFLFFILFDLGHSAARHINRYFGDHRPWASGDYFTFLIAAALAFLFSFALAKTTGVSYKKCLFYVCGVMSFLMFTIVLCVLPRFHHIYPILFNGLFSLVFSFIAAAPDILLKGGRQ